MEMSLGGRKRHGSSNGEMPAKRLRQEHEDTQTLVSGQLEATLLHSHQAKADWDSLVYSPFSSRSSSHRGGSPIGNDSSSSSSSSYTTLSSSRSISPVSPRSLSLPVQIVRSIRDGNNGQVFLAKKMTASCTLPCEEHEAAPQAAGQVQQQQQQNTALPHVSGEDGCGEFYGMDAETSAATVAVADAFMAVKLVRSSSRHVEREISCLRHLDGCHKELRTAAAVADAPCHPGDAWVDGRRCSAQLLTPALLPLDPSPRLFFTQQVGGYVAIGLELLGTDLFDFTERYFLHEEELCVVGIELLRVLNAIHQCGIVHRSVKPENFCWNREEISSCNGCGENGDAYCRENDDVSGSIEASPVFMFKIIDYGRSTVIANESTTSSSSYERPYRGWWHSLRGFLGKPMGQKDDLMGVVHIIGYLLDDYSRDGSTSSWSSQTSSPDRPGLSTCDNSDNKNTKRKKKNNNTIVVADTTTTTTTTTTTRTTSSSCSSAGGSTEERGAARFCHAARRERLQHCGEEEEEEEDEKKMKKRKKGHSPTPIKPQNALPLVTKSRSYSSWRHHLADKISDAYRVAAKRYRREKTLQRKQRDCGDANDIACGEEPFNAERWRNERRVWIVRHLEAEFLPSMLPDRYFPPNMPHWWVDLFTSCNVWCCDDAVSVEEMSRKMMERLQQQLERLGGTIDVLRHSLTRLYMRSREE